MCKLSEFALGSCNSVKSRIKTKVITGCPVRKDMDHPVNQSKLKVNRCSWYEVHENVFE